MEHPSCSSGKQQTSWWFLAKMFFFGVPFSQFREFWLNSSTISDLCDIEPKGTSWKSRSGVIILPTQTMHCEKGKSLKIALDFYRLIPRVFGSVWFDDVDGHPPQGLWLFITCMHLSGWHPWISMNPFFAGLVDSTIRPRLDFETCACVWWKKFQK